MWDRYDIWIALVAALVAGFVAMMYWKIMPSVESVHQLANLLDTKGGIILMLAGMSLVFFFTGMRWLYWSTMLIVDKKLTADNALVLNGFNWISGAAFMGAFGAMLNAMKGEAIVPPPPGSGTITTSTTTTAKTTDAPTGGQP